MLIITDRSRFIAIQSEGAARTGNSGGAQLAIMRRKIGAGRLVPAVIKKLMIKNFVRTFGPGISGALNQEPGLLVGSGHARPVSRLCPDWPRIIIPERDAGFVEPDGAA